MKRYRLPILACLIVLWVYAPTHGQAYKAMMEDLSINVYEVRDSAEAWFATHPKGKGSGYKGYQRWLRANEPRFYPDGDRSNFDPRQAAKAYYAFLRDNPSTRRQTAANCWRYLGPDYANNQLSPSWAPGVGRIEAVWAGFATTDTIFTGSRSGGFWKTYDGGITWRSTTQFLPAMGVLDIEVHPDRHNEVYIISRHATGYSSGILKSTDYGDTWNPTGFTFNQANNIRLRNLVIASSDTMYVSGSNGVHRSTDGAATWTQVRSGGISAFEVQPGNSQRLYIFSSGNNTQMRISTDGGASWGTLTNIFSNSSNPRLAVSTANPNILYMVSNSGVFRSTDAGLSFSFRSPDPTNSGVMTMGVSDTDPNRIFVGSLDQFSSTDGGANFSTFAGWVNYAAPNYLHADGRVVRSWNGVVYMGTDGFLGRSTDNGVNWTRVNETGMGVREFYRIGSSPTRMDISVGGSQDNGTSVQSEGTWYEWIGADGMQAHVDRNNPDTWFGTIQLGSLQRTDQGGQNAVNISPDQNGNWITPSVLDPSNDNTLFIAYRDLYKTNDNGDTWTKLASFNAGNMNEIAIAPSDSNFIYLSSGGSMWRSTTNGISWTSANSGLPGQFITAIAVAPDNPQEVFASISGYNSTNKVFRSTNAGGSWSNITYNLPNLPANCVATEEGPDGRLWVGMDVGVYYKAATSNTWTLYADSLPALEVNDLEILHGAHRIRACTWGRGLWEADLPGTASAPVIARIDLSPRPDFDYPDANDSMWVKAVILDSGMVQSAKLRWGIDGQNYPHEINMGQLQGDTFVVDTAIPAQPLGTRVYFRITATDDSQDSTRSDKIMYKVREAILCTASGAQGTTFDFIDTVRIHTLEHASLQEYYGDFRNLSTTLDRDSSYQLQFHINYAFPLDSAFAWIDWNDNNRLTDPGEQIIMSAPDLNSNVTGTVTVPSNAVLDTVVMRVRVMYSNAPFADPCGDYFGEVEDYSLVIRDQHFVHVEPSGSMPFAVYPNPADAVLEVRFEAGLRAPTWEVMDMKGRRMLVHALDEDAKYLRLRTEDLSPGIYLLVIRQGDRKWIDRFSIQR